MVKPRIKGADERIIQAFLKRKIFKNKAELVSAAIRALVREQMQKDAEREKTDKS